MYCIGESLKLNCFDGLIFVENLVKKLFGEIIVMGFDFWLLEICEIDLLVIYYLKVDWLYEIRNDEGKMYVKELDFVSDLFG